MPAGGALQRSAKAGTVALLNTICDHVAPLGVNADVDVLGTLGDLSAFASGS